MSSDNFFGCLQKSWHSQDKNPMPVSCKKLALILSYEQKDLKFFHEWPLCVERGEVGARSGITTKVVKFMIHQVT